MDKYSLLLTQSETAKSNYVKYEPNLHEKREYVNSTDHAENGVICKENKIKKA